MLRDYDPREKDLNRLAEDMVIEARRRQAGEREDDVTVLALMLGRNKRLPDKRKGRSAAGISATGAAFLYSAPRLCRGAGKA